jgi:RHS repeat-associated protein
MASKYEDGKGLWRFNWDHENRLYEASTRKQRIRYRYDALGRRISRYIVGGKENTKFTYDGNDVVLDDNSGVITKYQNGLGIDNKLKMVTNGISKYFLQDHLGSTTALTNSSGSVTESAAYDSFGNATGNLSTRYQFTGREYDNAIGLTYYRARWYSSELGRFVSEDPIGLLDGVNTYAYVKNNPVNKIDPSGKIGLPFLGLFPSAPKDDDCDKKSCERDIALMEETYNRVKDEMTASGQRSPYPISNGVSGTMGGAELSCVDQALAVISALQVNKYENDWQFGKESLPFAYVPEAIAGQDGSAGRYDIHTWVKASSQKCGSRRFDPWLGVSHNVGTNTISRLML